MPIVDVVDSKKKKVGSVDLPDAVFGCKPHGSLVHEAVVMQRACDRQGTASTLRRGEVSELRYTNYLALLDEVEEQNYWERRKEI